MELEEAVVICSDHYPVFYIRLDDMEQKYMGMIMCLCCLFVSSLSIHTNISYKFLYDVGVFYNECKPVVIYMKFFRV